jgi:hypothetical protein
MLRVDGDGIFCAIRGVTRSLQLRKSKGSSSIHQLHALVIYSNGNARCLRAEYLKVQLLLRVDVWLMLSMGDASSNARQRRRPKPNR